MEVTGAGADGGIDGHGRLRVGVATMRAAFQCKRWEGSVGRPEVDKFRGAIQGEFEQGLFPVGTCGADFAAAFSKENQDLGRVIHEANIKVE